ncbi:MAG TPA: ElyC/SanA/YdcF family protein, partial [bacterium]|nr:ElyC/SanA/YdcF family protein [bacterium]
MDAFELAKDNGRFYRYQAALYNIIQENAGRKEKGLDPLPMPKIPRIKSFGQLLAVGMIRLALSINPLKSLEDLMKSAPTFPSPMTRFLHWLNENFVDGIAARELAETLEMMGEVSGVVTTHTYGARGLVRTKKWRDRIVNMVPDPGFLRHGSTAAANMTTFGVLNILSDQEGAKWYKGMFTDRADVIGAGTAMDPEALKIAERGAERNPDGTYNLDKKFRRKTRDILLSTSGNAAHIDQIAWTLREMKDDLVSGTIHGAGRNKWKYRVFVFLGDHPDSKTKEVRDIVEELRHAGVGEDRVIIINNDTYNKDLINRLNAITGLNRNTFQNFGSIKYILQAFCHIEICKPGENPMSSGTLGTYFGSWPALAGHEKENYVYTHDEWDSNDEIPVKKSGESIYAWLNDKFDDTKGRSLAQGKSENGYNRAPAAASWVGAVAAIEKALGIYDSGNVSRLAQDMYTRAPIAAEKIETGAEEIALASKEERHPGVKPFVSKLAKVLKAAGLSNLKTGMIVTRMGGVDGVALETEKWFHVFRRAAVKLASFIGEGKVRTEGVETVLDEIAGFDDPVSDIVISLSFLELSGIERLKSSLEKLDILIEKTGLDIDRGDIVSLKETLAQLLEHQDKVDEQTATRIREQITGFLDKMTEAIDRDHEKITGESFDVWLELEKLLRRHSWQLYLFPDNKMSRSSRLQKVALPLERLDRLVSETGIRIDRKEIAELSAALNGVREQITEEAAENLRVQTGKIAMKAAGAAKRQRLSGNKAIAGKLEEIADELSFNSTVLKDESRDKKPDLLSIVQIDIRETLEKLKELEMPREHKDEIKSFSNEIEEIIKASWKMNTDEFQRLLAEKRPILNRIVKILMETRIAQIEDRLDKWVKETGTKVVVLENCNTIPMQLPLGVAIARLARRYAVSENLEEREITFVNHNHDFWFERRRYQAGNRLNDVGGPYLDEGFPLAGSNVIQMFINTVARDMLLERLKKLSAEAKERGDLNRVLIYSKEIQRIRSMGDDNIVPNVMDYEEPVPELNDYNRDFRDKIGVGRDDILIGSVVRMVERKSLEFSLKLLQRLKASDPKNASRYRLILTGGDESIEGGAYVKSVKNYVSQLGLRFGEDVIIVSEKKGITVGLTQGTEDGRKVYTLDDIYANIDFISYPSTYEGFGNALLEAIWAKLPVIAYPYSIFESDIRKPLDGGVLEFPGLDRKELQKEFGIDVNQIQSRALQILLEYAEALPEQQEDMLEELIKLTGKALKHETVEKFSRAYMKRFDESVNAVAAIIDKFKDVPRTGAPGKTAERVEKIRDLDIVKRAFGNAAEHFSFKSLDKILAAVLSRSRIVKKAMGEEINILPEESAVRFEDTAVQEPEGQPATIEESRSDIQKLADFLAPIDWVPSQPDLMLILGTHDTRVIDEAAKLYISLGRKPKAVIFSGGRGRSSQLLQDKTGLTGSEAEILAELFKRALRANGVLQIEIDRINIILETESENTGQNIQFSKRIIEERGLPSAKTIVIQSPALQKRSMATFEKEFGFEGISYTYRPDTASMTQQETEDLAGWMTGEVDRLRRYGPEGEGFIAAVDVPEDIKGIASRLSKMPELAEEIQEAEEIAGARAPPSRRRAILLGIGLGVVALTVGILS